MHTAHLLTRVPMHQAGQRAWPLALKQLILWYADTQPFGVLLPDPPFELKIDLKSIN